MKFLSVFASECQYVKMYWDKRVRQIREEFIEGIDKNPETNILAKFANGNLLKVNSQAVNEHVYSFLLSDLALFNTAFKDR